MIRSLLISRFLNDARLARVLAEILDIGAGAGPDEKLVVVVDSEGGSLPALLAFIDCVLGDLPTKALIEKAEVKIYEAYSAAALLAFWIGTRREMAAGTRVGFHLPMLTLRFWQVDRECRRIDPNIVEQCRQYEDLLAGLMKRYGLIEPELHGELYNSGWLYLSADECFHRGLVQSLFPAPPATTAATQGDCAGRTILVSGPITKERLDRLFDELSRAADNSDCDPILIIDSTGGNSAATLRFLDKLRGDTRLRQMADRVKVKIYEAQSAATLLAFAFGSTRELWKEGKVGFHVGERIVQVGNPDHYGDDGCLTPQFVGRWQECRDAVYKLLRDLGLDADTNLWATFYAREESLELSAQECLSTGIVSRLF
jgi:ATP-dependent protease ClpP protease subunit